MNKSIRNFVLVAVLSLSATPMFANLMGTNPHPLAVSISLGDYVSIALSVFGY
jgi:hypothetical protein